MKTCSQGTKTSLNTTVVSTSSKREESEVVEDARRRRRVRTARVEPEPFGVRRHDERDRVVLVARDEWRDVGEEEPVGHRRRRRDRLCPAHDDPAVGLLDDTGVEEGLR